MVSDFRKKKLMYAFSSFFDENNSGTIDKKDFQLAAEQIAKMRGWASGSAQQKELESSLMKIWDSLQSHADKDKDGQISADEWLSMWEDYAKNPSAPLEWQKLYCKLIFDLQDASNDGSIDATEFSTVCESFGIKKDEAVTSFAKMAKGKSNISWAEFQQLWQEYFVSEDPSAPGNHIFGKSTF
ncbi:calexcitin-2-like [Aricia agestis]|uniref:calexcitin-2-like n=1 Tax=Aricia agestis TaxID=91739 RepID=UPI001C206051|nr:calexcitin-2-like [Aricia agestis]